MRTTPPISTQGIHPNLTCRHHIDDVYCFRLTLDRPDPSSGAKVENAMRAIR